MIDEWEAELPPAGFADGVMGRIAAERRRKTRRRWTYAAGGSLALAAAILIGIRARPEQGAAIAKDRTEVSIGHRARAVLEPGADVAWKGDDVTQTHGDVFYRVEPGKRFVVHTPAGDVRVEGTCFSVKLRERDMNLRDVKSGVVGAGISAMAFVAVYEGKVSVSHAKTAEVELAAGDNAQVGPDGVHRTNGDAARVFDAEQPKPLEAANENLVGQVREYRTRLETIMEQKSDLEDKLKTAEQRLASAGDGGAATAATSSNEPPTADEWKQLAKEGRLRFRYPCTNAEGRALTPDQLNKLGLAPQDGAVLKEAMDQSAQRMWAEIGPLCASALGVGADVAQRIGLEQCRQIVVDKLRRDDPENAAELQTQAAEIRAGVRPEPPPGKVPPLLKIYLLVTGAESAFEGDLAKSFGPEEAHRIATSDHLCASNFRIGGGKKRE